MQKAEAYQKGEGRKREAEAAVLEVQNRAMAKAALAEAERVEAEQRAKLEAPAKAQKARILVDAEAEAEKRRLEAEGEAAAIFAKLEAEARGQYEILAKKGEGLKQIVEACGGAKQAFQLLMLEHLDKLAEASRQGDLQHQVRQDRRLGKRRRRTAASNTADFLHKMAGTLPPMMQVMRDIGGIDIPESLAKLAGEDGAQGRDRPRQGRGKRRDAGAKSKSIASTASSTHLAPGQRPGVNLFARQRTSFPRLRGRSYNAVGGSRFNFEPTLRQSHQRTPTHARRDGAFSDHHQRDQR